MRSIARADGFTLPELLISTAIILMTLGAALTTFSNAVSLTQSTTELTDSNQNLRAGTNLLARDLLQAARGIPTGGLPIPSGVGAQAINRPSPPGLAYTFDNVNSTTLPAIIPGAGLGPTIDGQATDIVTILMTDSLLGSLGTNTGLAGQAKVATNGANVDVGANAAWLAGNPAQGIPPVAPGDLIWFSNANGNALQTVTSVDPTHMYFALNDWFNFNQPGAAQGSITQIASNPMPPGSVARVIMLTYYVDAVTAPATPRLTRVQNAHTPQAMAGVIEDLDLSYDLVDGVTNPINQKTVPYTDPVRGITYSPNQIRKVNLHAGVRSDTLSPQHDDYIRNHLSTVISIRSLAFVNRYR
jgi:prepilin-type N-terminal cleavage/methylation domain-containing protein